MASTYSTLKIQLMTTGENSGTWGTVTNTNLGTALEEAIVGSADVTFASANQTLTLTDTNATQTARNLRLNCTGTTGGSTRTLTVPAIEKVYIVNNGCADSITIKNATGTGITVPAGKTMWVYNNATNVVDVTTYLSSLTLGTALAVADGGTGSNTATFSGANITSLNANNISAGQLATARGGTNLTTFTAANNAIYSTSASVLTAGTLPIEAGGTGSTTATFSGANITSLNANNISSGTLAVARGGTGTTTLTAENVIIGNTTGAVKFVAPGTSGNVLTSNGTAWLSQAGGATGVTTFSAGTTGFTPSTATAGAVTLAGTLATANGGTNLTGFTAANNAIYSTSSSVLTAGTLPITAGGTGSTTATFSGANITSLNANNISAGQLATARGGTNLTGFTAANNAIYSTSSSALTAGTLPITAGGTGATSAATALSNLGGIGSTSTQVAKAWVKFNGTGTVAINANYNVSSITDNNTGQYTVNFSSALSDSNYVVCALGGYTTGVGPMYIATPDQTTDYTQTTSAFSFGTGSAHATGLPMSNYDASKIYLAFFR